ncbi:oxidoreductase [Longibacter salinarum]|uniref:Oxidoreductase n=1 Tax=Longibacter salinarum TaxID=1850348 RepID=A0A2A8CUD0_9BACT|nr:SDR family oxidoreductase [Longibacter salinarum]PEN11478.1 oxidoreductase [Longibacter salinarum]
MDLQIEGKTAFISGSTAGIGWATARQLAEEGATVIINGRTADRVDAAVERITDAVAGATVRGVAADLGTADGVEKVTDAEPDIDILVNNVGIFEPSDFADTDDEAWMKHFEVNVMSGVRLTRHYLPGMKKRGWGRVVFVSSESGVQIPEEMIHYGVTKTAQIGLARGIAETTKGAGNVTVNSVLPGPTASEGVGDFVERLAEEQGLTAEEIEEQFFNEARPTSLLQRFEEPEEIASMIAYVCSENASATNGAALRVDGGVVRSAF